MRDIFPWTAAIRSQLFRWRRLIAPRLFAVLVAAAGLAVIGGGLLAREPATVARAQEGPVIGVTAQRPFQFTPREITVIAGTTVRWAPAGTNPHTITSDGCAEPAAGACVFDSGLDAAGRAAGARVPAEQFVQANTARSSFEFRFSDPGIYAYFCRLHGAPGGVGESGIVNVIAPGQLAPPGPLPPSAAQLRPPLSVVVYTPAEGQLVQGTSVPVQLGINGATVRPEVIGQVDRRFGHFNLILDANLDLSAFVQAAEGAVRVNTNSFTLENVRPGSHTLTVVWTFDNNVPPQPPITATVRFTIQEAPQTGAAAISPPSTGDGGLARAAPGDSRKSVTLSAALLATGLGTGAMAIGRRRRLNEQTR